jgi:hypothetical protein
MRSDEKWLTRQMRQKFTHTFLLSFEACRIPSVPDLYAIDLTTAISYWIEGKAIPTPGAAISYSGGQEKWIRDLEKAGGIVFVAVLIKSTHCLRLLRSGEEIAQLDLMNPLWALKLERILGGNIRVGKSPALP